MAKKDAKAEAGKGDAAGAAGAAPAAPAAPASGEKEFSIAEIAAHNSSSSAFLAIHGAVYDITPYLNDHPGGSEIMLQHAGKVATNACVAARLNGAAR